MLRRFTIFLATCAALHAAAVVLETGEIGGAKFTLARTNIWNKRLLLLAHGLIDADRPLVADLATDQLSHRTLLDEGWIVATTSFRRNGMVIGDAIADLDALRAHIEKKFGAPERVLLEGDSMGGLIVTLIAERDLAEPRLYHGAIAVGAALSAQESGSSGGISLEPRIPLLFLSNQSEIAPPTAYVTAKIPRDNPALRPVLFRVSRDGHVNVNQRERLAALRALTVWLDVGRERLPAPAPGTPFFDATVPTEPQPSQVTLHADHRGFDARVVEISGNYGNVFLNVQPADFTAIGLAKMQWLELSAHGQTFRARLGNDFSSVKRGEWVLFPNADGFVWLARNSADAAATARLAVGDPVTLRRYNDSK